MVRTCVSGWTWSSGSKDHSPRPWGGGEPMARRTFDVIDVCEIFTHWHAGRSKNEIAGSLGLSRNTVRKYVAAAEAAGLARGGAPVSQEQWAELARQWFPELADTRLRACGQRVRDGAVLLAAHVRPAGDQDGPAGVDRVPCGGVRVLRRGAREAGAGQPEDGGGPAGPV